MGAFGILRHFSRHISCSSSSTSLGCWKPSRYDCCRPGHNGRVIVVFYKKSIDSDPCGQTRYLPSLVSSALITSSKSVPSPNLFAAMISLFNSKTDIPVPSKAILEGSFWDLNRKKTDEDMNVMGSEDRMNGFRDTHVCVSSAGAARSNTRRRFLEHRSGESWILQLDHSV